jgi:hypothetical protein
MSELTPNEHKEIISSQKFIDAYHQHLGVKPGEKIKGKSQKEKKQAFEYAYKIAKNDMTT